MKKMPDGETSIILGGPCWLAEFLAWFDGGLASGLTARGLVILGHSPYWLPLAFGLGFPAVEFEWVWATRTHWSLLSISCPLCFLLESIYCVARHLQIQHGRYPRLSKVYFPREH